MVFLAPHHWYLSLLYGGKTLLICGIDLCVQITMFAREVLGTKTLSFVCWALAWNYFLIHFASNGFFAEQWQTLPYEVQPHSSNRPFQYTYLRYNASTIVYSYDDCNFGSYQCSYSCRQRSLTIDMHVLSQNSRACGQLYSCNSHEHCVESVTILLMYRVICLRGCAAGRDCQLCPLIDCSQIESQGPARRVS